MVFEEDIMATTLDTETKAGAAVSPMLIGGDWVNSAQGGTIEVRNPANHDLIATVPRGGTRGVDRAVAAAATAFESWKLGAAAARRRAPAARRPQRAHGLRRGLRRRPGRASARAQDLLHRLDRSGPHRDARGGREDRAGVAGAGRQEPVDCIFRQRRRRYRLGLHR